MKRFIWIMIGLLMSMTIVNARITCGDHPLVINSSLTMDRDLSEYDCGGTPCDCIMIDGDDVELDCNNHRIDNGNDNIGIIILGDNVEVKNCEITESYIEGIEVYGRNTSIHNNKFYASDVGLFLSEDEAVISHNVFSGEEYAIHLEGSSQVTLSYNTIKNIGVCGIHAMDAPENQTQFVYIYQNEFENISDYYIDTSNCAMGSFSLSYSEDRGVPCDEESFGPDCHGNYYDEIHDSRYSDLVDTNSDGYYDDSTAGENETSHYPFPADDSDKFNFGEDATISPDFGPRVHPLSITPRRSHHKTEHKLRPELRNRERFKIGNQSVEEDEKGRYVVCYGGDGFQVNLGDQFPGYTVFAKYHDIIVARCTTDSEGKCNLVVKWPGEFVIDLKKGSSWVKVYAKEECGSSGPETSEPETSTFEGSSEGSPKESSSPPVQPTPEKRIENRNVGGNRGTSVSSVNDLSVAMRYLLGVI